MKRRDLLKLFGVAPAVILTPGLLMPVKPLTATELANEAVALTQGNIAKLLQEGLNRLCADWKADPLYLSAAKYPGDWADALRYREAHRMQKALWGEGFVSPGLFGTPKRLN